MLADSGRRVATAVILAALVATAGCSAGGLGLGGGGGSGVSAESVPGDADFVMTVDVDGMLEDSTNRELFNGLLAMGPGSDTEEVEGVLDDFESDSGLDPRNADEVLVFGKSDPESQQMGESYGAVIVVGDYTTDQILSAGEEEGVSLTESEYAGKTVYEPEQDLGSTDGWIGVLGDGRYVLGTEQAVKDAIDVENGDADALSGDLETAYENTRDGYLRFAWSVPTESIPTESVGSQTELNVEAFTSLTTVGGAYYTDGDQVGLSVSMQTGDEGDATDVYDVTNGAVSLVRGGTDNEDIKSALENVDVEQDGTSVTVSYSNTPDGVVSLLEALSRSGVAPPVPPV